MEERDVSLHRGLIGAQPAPAATDQPVTRQASREGGFSTGWLVAPSVVWLLLFLVIPLISIFIFSFWTSTGHGLQPGFHLQNYAEYFVSDGFFDPESRRFLSPSVFVKTLGSTFRFTFEVMLLCLLIGYPIAYFLAMRVNSFKWQMALFLLCMVPFWTSYLIRAVAWLPMLGRRGLLNSMLLALDVIDKPTRVLLYSEFGYTTALVQIYVVLCVGPIFFSLAKIDLGNTFLASSKIGSRSVYLAE